MRKIVFLIILTMLGSVCFAQRNGGSRSSSTRGSSPTRSSVSARPVSPSRSNVSTNRTSTYNPSRSSATRTSTRTNSFSRSEARSTRVAANPTTTVRNTPRSQNNGVNMNSRPNSRPRVSSHGTHSYNHPHPGHHPNVGHHPHHAPHGMHPAPPMYHPVHHRPICMRHHALYNWMVADLYWCGYWNYVRLYSYNDVVIHVQSAYPSTHVITIATDEEFVYTIYRDELVNETYFTITDNTDNVVVKTPIGRKYCRIILDEEGIWVMRKNDRKPIYFIYEEGKLYRYDTD